VVAWQRGGHCQCRCCACILERRDWRMRLPIVITTVITAVNHDWCINVAINTLLLQLLSSLTGLFITDQCYHVMLGLLLLLLLGVGLLDAQLSKANHQLSSRSSSNWLWCLLLRLLLLLVKLMLPWLLINFLQLLCFWLLVCLLLLLLTILLLLLLLHVLLLMAFQVLLLLMLLGASLLLLCSLLLLRLLLLHGVQLRVMPGRATLDIWPLLPQQQLLLALCLLLHVPLLPLQLVVLQPRLGSQQPPLTAALALLALA
jgi:hypothetical protein